MMKNTRLELEPVFYINLVTKQPEEQSYYNLVQQIPVWIELSLQ